MKVYLDEFGSHGDGPDVIVVDLDDGTNVSAWCVVENAESERATFEKHLDMIRNEAVAQLKAENERLRNLIDTPQTKEFLEAVTVEVAHQRDRWGDAHDAHKEVEDWFWTLGRLAGKAVSDPSKRLHHIVTSAALLAQWHRHESKEKS